MAAAQTPILFTKEESQAKCLRDNIRTDALTLSSLHKHVLKQNAAIESFICLCIKQNQLYMLEMET